MGVDYQGESADEIRQLRKIDVNEFIEALEKEVQKVRQIFNASSVPGNVTRYCRYQLSMYLVQELCFFWKIATMST